MTITADYLVAESKLLTCSAHIFDEKRAYELVRNNHSRHRRHNLQFEHGLALVNEIPNTKLIILGGTGHVIHSNDGKTTIGAISVHTS